jgi:tight adherence protein B
MLPSLPGLMAGLSAAFVICGLILAGRFIIGTTPDPLRPPPVTDRLLAALRSPAVTGRVGAGILVGVLTLVVTHWLVAAAALMALVIAWPSLFGGARLERQQIARLEGLVMWTESLRDTLAAHSDLEHAVPASIASAPEVIRPALLRLQDLRRGKVPLPVALYALSAELADVSADIVIGALIINTMHTGEGLTDVLTRLVASGRRELDLRRHVTAGRASTRRASKIIVGITVGFATGMALFNPTFVQPYNSVTGQLVMLLVVGIFAGAFLLMRQLAGGDTSEPFLNAPGARIGDTDHELIAHLTGLSAAQVSTMTARGTATIGGRR